MKHRLLSLAVCGVVVLSACSKQSTAPAATVNGKAIASQALIDELEAIGANKPYLDQLSSTGKQQGVKVLGSKPGTFDMAFAATTLREQIYFRLVRDEVQAKQLTVEPQCAEAARKEVYARVGSSDQAKGKTTFEQFPKRYQDTLLQRYGDLLVLQARLAGQPCVAADAAKAYYEAHQSEFLQACASVIVVADQAAADAAKARLDAGEAFATVAAATSADKSSAQGGDVGCKTKGELQSEAIPAFFSTPVGQVSAPVALRTGFVIVKVTDRRQAALDDVRQQASELAASQVSTAFQAFLQQAVKSATITVDPRYGTWNSQKGDITPPVTSPTGTASTGSTASTGAPGGASSSGSGAPPSTSS